MTDNLTLEKIIDFLLDVEMFSALDIGELSEIVSIMDIQRIKSGEHIFSEGEVGDGWYVIFEGTVIVRKRTPFHRDQEVAELGPGACFGEMALLDDAPRSATVMTNSALLAFRFSRRKFLRLLHQDSLGAYKLVYGMACVLARRQRKLNQNVTELQREVESLDRESALST